MNEDRDSTLSIRGGQMYLHQGPSGDIQSSYGVMVIEDLEALDTLIDWLIDARNYMLTKETGE